MADPLERRLAALAGSLDWPAMRADPVSVVGARIRAGDARPARWWERAGGRPIRRGLLVAVAALLLLAATVAAAGILLPGLRILFIAPGATVAPATPGEAPSGGPLGSGLGLGAAVVPEEAARIAGFELLLPSGLGWPQATYLAGARVTMVWPSGPGLPETAARGVGLLVTEFRGVVDTGFYEKLVQQGDTTVEPVLVDGRPGYWLSGAPHSLVYRGRDGTVQEETRRVVGDVLVWQQGELTLRLESALGRDATIELAESLEAPAD